MNRRVRLAVITIFAAFALPLTLDAQMTMRPTPYPVVTAEDERWLLSGEPITSDGVVYYPTGAQVYFNPYEMVRSGYYRGVPLYSKTTLEPYSVVFVPLPGGLMQPYERRREGDVAGTAGSTVPSFPVTRDVEGTSGLIEAPGPPTSLSGAKLAGPCQTRSSPCPRTSHRTSSWRPCGASSGRLESPKG